jgi:phage-related protein
MAALPHTSLLSQSATRTRTQRVLSAAYGDGYSHDVPDGINSQLDNWSIQWENMTASERDAVVAVLDAVGQTDILTWTPPGSSSEKKFKVTNSGYTETFSAGNIYNISLTLRQVF